MRIDNETGECLSVSYEMYEEMKEEKEAEIEMLEQKIEDLEDEVYQLKEELEKAKCDSKFYKTICKIWKKQEDRVFGTKKDSLTATNESK